MFRLFFIFLRLDLLSRDLRRCLSDLHTTSSAAASTSTLPRRPCCCCCIPPSPDPLGLPSPSPPPSCVSRAIEERRRWRACPRHPVTEPRLLRERGGRLLWSLPSSPLSPLPPAAVLSCCKVESNNAFVLWLCFFAIALDATSRAC